MSNITKRLTTYLKDGAEVPAGEGGEAVFTQPLDIAHSCELKPDKPLPWRTALYVTEEGVAPEKSARDALSGGSVGEKLAEDVELVSRSDDFSALTWMTDSIDFFIDSYDKAMAEVQGKDPNVIIITSDDVRKTADSMRNRR